MRVLMITGDRSFKAGHPRFDVQAGAVERLEALYWGPGAPWQAPKSDSYDAVSTQDPFWRGLVGLFWARRLKARLNVQVHADIQAQPIFKRLLARFVLCRADSVRVVSEKLKAYVTTIFRNVGRPTSNISVLPIFIDTERFRNIQRAPSAEPLVLWVGRFEDEKDPLLALRVFREVLEYVPEAKMVMLGAGSLAARLRRAAEGFPVEFPGWQDTLPYLARAHIVLSTSRAESYGASIVEALAAGVSVVAPDVGIAHEAGATIAPREQLADAVVKMLKTPQRATLNLALLPRAEWVAAWKQSFSSR